MDKFVSKDVTEPSPNLKKQMENLDFWLIYNELTKLIY
ncbi:hypothetical protein PSPO_a2892 [Pseudoalteromonas spongiae UST010723-006]|nr:hypothetical protein PSPO_a2892 [Pseudoalteromonas spongiae UST010723-006]